MTQNVLLGDITSYLARGSAPKYTDKEDFYVINQKCIRDWRVSIGQARFTDISLKKVTEDRILRANDILVNSTGQGTLGRVGQFFGLDKPATVDSHVTIVRPDESQVNPIFLGYVLKGREKDIEALAEGSTGQTELSRFKLADLRIKMPDLDTQKKIADILGSIDEKIEQNRQMNETLEQMGQALFRHYFIDNPEAEKWESGNFSDVTEVLTGKGSVKSQMSEAGQVPLYGANGIMGTSEDYLYDEPLIITGRVGTLGRVRAVTGQAWYSDNVLIMKPKSGYYGYVLHVARSFDYISMNRGSSQPLITQTDLKNRKIKLPDEKALLNFENQHDGIFEQQQKNEEQIQTLTTLRDTLLPRLINGKVKLL